MLRSRILCGSDRVGAGLVEYPDNLVTIVRQNLYLEKHSAALVEDAETVRNVRGCDHKLDRFPDFDSDPIRWKSELVLAYADVEFLRWRWCRPVEPVLPWDQRGESHSVDEKSDDD